MPTNSPITERMVSDFCRKRIAPHLLPVHTEALRKFLIAAVETGAGIPRYAGKYDWQSMSMITNVPHDMLVGAGRHIVPLLDAIEYLLGMYCASDDEATIRDGLESVKQILSENYVRPDEAEKVKSKIRERGSYKVIDKVTVRLNEKRDIYEALLSNLGVKDAEISSSDVKKYEKLLAGGIWSIVTIHYFFEEGQRKSPFSISDIKPIQMPNMDMAELFEGRKGFAEGEWLDVLLRSTGMEPSHFNERTKWHLLTRLIPFVENNYNVCELGPRGTGKSHVYKECSPNSILVSGGQTTVANLFYNMASRSVGLVGLWDVVAFDEVAGISFKDKDGVQIMKDFMASGSFARGRDAIAASASTGHERCVLMSSRWMVSPGSAISTMMSLAGSTSQQCTSAFVSQDRRARAVAIHSILRYLGTRLRTDRQRLSVIILDRLRFDGQPVSDATTTELEGANGGKPYRVDRRDMESGSRLQHRHLRMYPLLRHGDGKAPRGHGYREIRRSDQDERQAHRVERRGEGRP